LPTTIIILESNVCEPANSFSKNVQLKKKPMADENLLNILSTKSMIIFFLHFELFPWRASKVFFCSFVAHNPKKKSIE
jgi:hypothetical protein